MLIEDRESTPYYSDIRAQKISMAVSVAKSEKLLVNIISFTCTDAACILHLAVFCLVKCGIRCIAIITPLIGIII